MEDGTLHCSYHGWRFDASGRCTHIPQVSGKAAATACASQRSCVGSFPTQVLSLPHALWQNFSAGLEWVDCIHGLLLASPRLAVPVCADVRYHPYMGR